MRENGCAVPSFRAFGFLVGASFCAPAFAQTDVPPELWDRPRTGAVVLAQESIRQVVGAALPEPHTQIVIRHPAGQEPQIQAEELRAWLGALAIDPRRIVLRGDLAAKMPMKLELVR
jgi:hypothetical protein